MLELLQTVRDYGSRTPETLRERGYHENVIYGKALSASDKGYTDYGVVVDRPWLTEKGTQVLMEWES